MPEQNPTPETGALAPSPEGPPAPSGANLPALATSLAIEEQRAAGINALARLSDSEFDARLVALKAGLDRFDRLMREVLTSGPNESFDLAKIKGIEKPILTLAGAEKIGFIARLVPSYVIERTLGDSVSSPPIHYVVTTRLHLGNTEGPIVAEGVGSCTSWETKYRFRYSERNCPVCGAAGTIRLSNFPAKGGPWKGEKGWYCFKKIGGCGVEFAPNDAKITDQRPGLIENPNPHDLDNTLLKIAKKRSYVDATKTAVAASGKVTQDLEESAGSGTSTETGSGLMSSEEAISSIYDTAKRLGWTTFAPLLDLATKATGKPVKTEAQFRGLPLADLRKVLDAMPKPIEGVEPGEEERE